MSTNPAKDVSFPDSVVSMMRGDLGQPPSGWPKALPEQGAQGREALYGADPARCCRMPISKPNARRSRTKLEREVSEFEFASYLMYPKVFTDFALARKPTVRSACCRRRSILRAPVGGELFVEIEKGKTLVIRMPRPGRPDDKGMVTVFFELNGQPRRVKVPDRAHGASGSAARRKAEAGNDAHVAPRCQA
jgi:pyruvate carboxylase